MINGKLHINNDEYILSKLLFFTPNIEKDINLDLLREFKNKNYKNFISDIKDISLLKILWNNTQIEFANNFRVFKIYKETKDNLFLKKLTGLSVLWFLEFIQNFKSKDIIKTYLDETIKILFFKTSQILYLVNFTESQ